MTRVNVDDVAFMDRRFKLLGGRLAITWQEALGRCLPVWALAYAKRTAILPAGDIDALAERPGFAAALADVDLAAEDEGGLYLRGVADRIDFLLIQDAKRAKARQAKLDAHGVPSPRRPSRGTRAKPEDIPAGPSRGTLPEEGPYSPDLDLDPAPDLDQEELSPACAIPAPEPVPPPAPEPILPASQERADRRRALIASAWQLGGEAFRRIQAKGIDSTVPSMWRGLPSADNTAMVNLRAIADSLLIGERPNYDEASATIARRIAVAEAEAEVKRTVEYMTPARMWRRESFDIAAGMTPDQVRRKATQTRPSAKGDPQSTKRTDHGQAPVTLKRTAAEIAELSAMAGAVGSMPTSELVKKFGDGARAPPASTATITDESKQPPTRKAT